MTVGMLAGCGGSDSAATAGNAETADTAGGSTSAASEEARMTASIMLMRTAISTKKFDDVTLNMLICWNGGFKTAQDQYNNDAAAAIREKIGVTVEFEGIMMSEAEKLNMMFASGDMPDMVNAPYWGGTAGETAIIKKAGVEGRLIDIKDLVPNYPNIADAYDIGVIGQKYLETDIDTPGKQRRGYVLPTEVAGDDADIAQWGIRRICPR